jgi:hypothetical protein
MNFKNLFLSLLLLLSATSLLKAQGIYLPQTDTARHDYRFNLLVGVSPGANIAEVGLLVNYDTKGVKYFQAAGFANIVNGPVEGVQLAGFANVDKGNVHAVQGAGFINVNASHTEGGQFAGFGNYSKSMLGIQAAGHFNIVRDSIEGIQAAGCFNAAGKVNGLQAAGLFNYASNMKNGIQIAPFNFADTSSGIALGLFSFIRQGGYHKIEVSADEVFGTNVSFRTGVKQFHNIITVGLRPENVQNPFWTYGYGVGTTFGLANKLDMDIDVTANHIDNGGYHICKYLSNDYKLYMGLDWHIAKKFSVAFGPTLNFYTVSRDNYDFSNAVDNIIPTSYLYNQPVGNDKYLKVWAGGKVALRFL